MSGAEVLGVISAVITIIDTIKQIYDGVHDTTGLPEAFREVASRLPLVRKILESVDNHLRGNETHNSAGEAEAVLGQARTKVLALRTLFDKVIPLDDDPRMERYIKLVRTLGKGNKVETLMLGLMTDVQLSVSKCGLENATSQQIDQLRTAIEEISKIEPSIADSELPQWSFTNTNHGSGTQTNNNVEGDARLNQLYGNGTQNNYTGGVLNYGRKSQLAIEYAHETRQRSPDTWVFWVHASNVRRYEQGLREIADLVKIPGRGDPQENIFQLVRDWLRGQKSRKWRLILDNVDDANFLLDVPSLAPNDHPNNDSRPDSRRLVDYLPACENGSILITTRNKGAALDLVEPYNTLSVEPMERKEAEALIEAKLGPQQEIDYTGEPAIALEWDTRIFTSRSEKSKNR
ncbi:hypothetical protein KJ359_005420 [Pestalotiopsis sp. 9143b]|nr:hypothetical protein KJ359_005420 [Pestalotiopsis sp. 9143b]